jgi:hypothetical protein
MYTPNLVASPLPRLTLTLVGVRRVQMDDAWCVARGHDEKPATTTVRVSVSASVIVTPKRGGDGVPTSASASRKRTAGSMTPKNGSTSGRAAKGKGAKAPSSRGQLFQPTPEPTTPALGMEAAPAVRTSQRSNRGQGAKRHKGDEDGSELWSEEDGGEEEHAGGGQDSAEEWEATAREAAAAASFRDPTRNRRKPAKEMSYSPSASPEPAPAPRDVSRNRRKGKAERARDGVMEPLLLGPAVLSVAARKGTALSRKQPRWEAAMLGAASDHKENVDENKVAVGLP